MTTRRQFITTGAAAAAAFASRPSLALSSGHLARPAAAEKLGTIGLQLYTVRREMGVSVEDTLRRVAAVGYREVEFAGYFSRDPSALRATLDALALSAPSCHVGLDAVEAQFGATVAAAKTLGHRWVTVASTPRSHFQSVAAIKALATRFTEAGRRLRDVGMRFAYHNHNIELTAVEGAIPLDVLLGESDPALVDFEMDLYWTVQGGADPLAYFARFPGRFRLVHLKDSAGAPAHEMRDVGSGTIDWKAIFAKHRQAGVAHYIVEHDSPRDAYASVTASYQYLRAVEF